MEKTFKEHVKTGYCTLWLGIAFPIKLSKYIFIFLIWFFFVTGSLVLLWDSLVWLFKADWRTSEFQYPIWSIFIIICSSIIYGIAEALLSFVDDHLYIICDRTPDKEKEYS